jgi:hypothetical protein
MRARARTLLVRTESFERVKSRFRATLNEFFWSQFYQFLLLKVCFGIYKALINRLLKIVNNFLIRYSSTLYQFLPVLAFLKLANCLPTPLLNAILLGPRNTTIPVV